MSELRPALEVLRELDNGNLLDKIALALHDASQTTTALGKGSSVTVTFSLGLLTQKNLSEPVISMSAVVDSKLPKPDPHQSLFFIDEDGAFSKKPTRQAETGLTIIHGREV